MKKLKYFLLLAILPVLFVSCYDLDVPITTQITADAYPSDSAGYVSTAGIVYSKFRENYAMAYYFTTELSTDEAILPARGGNWFDNKGYRYFHYHEWTPDYGWANTCWDWLSGIIGYDNQAMYILEANMPAGSQKTRMLAELRTMRALSYFYFMDLFGNVPIYTTYGSFEQKAKSDRTEVFNFIESELKACVGNLTTDVSALTYGYPTQYLAYSLLAKLYLNAEYYTGTKRYDDCIAACDKVISSGKYSLATRSQYLKMFYPDNGPSTPEFIFAVPYNPSYTSGYMYRARYDVPRSEQAKFGLPFKPSAPESTLPEFYANFDDPNDVRNGQWLTGLQYLNDGVTPVTVTTTNQGYNQFYSGSDPKGTYTYQVNLSPNVTLRQDSLLFDCGNDEIAWNMGYRNIKFYPDATSTSRNQNNDMPVFRYSDILLMKAEAILRGGTATNGQTALSLVNTVRANRTTSSAWTTITLDSIYNERAREFAYETWRRNDMIRFGKYEGKWGFKKDASVYRRIYPIPTTALNLNKKLTQNPGY
ncbi:MAG: RagB/SusD family nutrient uptake outer membrane protein [Bacteroidetes bacterium]|jgi:starch-binding outer membrane protein, SusD/RagB family|nr:RagB/SusD family nutrient uptake outer membrane protein [Bacteroidota bacterium]